MLPRRSLGFALQLGVHCTILNIERVPFHVDVEIVARGVGVGVGVGVAWPVLARGGRCFVI